MSAAHVKNLRLPIEPHPLDVGGRSLQRAVLLGIVQYKLRDHVQTESTRLPTDRLKVCKYATSFMG
jgi:hypothetical protein